MSLRKFSNLSLAGMGCGGLLVLTLITGSIVYGTWKGYNNKFVSYEENILAIDTFITTTHNKIFQELHTRGIIAEAESGKLMEAIKLNMDAKIPVGTIQPGALGGMAVTRQNMGFDPTTYRQIQNAIAPHMKELSEVQKKKIKLVRDYNQSLRSIPDKWFAKWMDFPSNRIDLKKEAEVVASADSKKMQETKTMEIINPLAK